MANLIDGLKIPSSVYKTCLKPSIVQARVLNQARVLKKSSLTIEASFKQNNVTTQSVTHFRKLYSLKNNGTGIELEDLSGLALPGEEILLESVTNNQHNLRAVINKQIQFENNKQCEYILNVFSSTELKKSINLSSFDKHGIVHADLTFGALSWNVEGRKLLYVAEAKKKDSRSFYERLTETEKCGDKFAYEESWGEGIDNVINPVICIVDIDEERIEVLSLVDYDFSPVQPQWGPMNTIIFEGKEKLPFKLGTIYCGNRKSKIYQYDTVSCDINELSPKDILAANHHPRVNHAQTKCIFLHNPLSSSGDPHGKYNKLMMADLTNSHVKEIYNDSIIPLYTKELHQSSWFSDDLHVAFLNENQGTTYTYILNTSSGHLIATIPCTQFLGVSADVVLYSMMKLDFSQPVLCTAVLHNDEVVTSSPVVIKDDEIVCSSLVDDHGIKSSYVVPAKRRQNNEKWPVIVWPHGGPHTMHSDNYDHKAVAFCKLGYAVLLVNYRGSTGFSKESLMSLLGHIGTQDVQDVHAATLLFINMFQEDVDLNNIFVFGGSHGGFLGVHLLGQYPDFYRAASLRNPVIDLAAMFMTTDIPDWTYVESGLPYTQDMIPTPDVYSKLLQCSPIRYLKNIKSPILLLVGEKDLRVPPTQGKGFYRLLKANGKETKLLLYPNDCHPLSNVETDADLFLNTIKWFLTKKK